MKEELSRKEVTREIWNGFDVCSKYRVELVEKYRKMRAKHRFWAFSGDMYRYTLNMYRYMLDVYRYTLFCFSYFDQFSYFDRNFLISDPI